MHLRATQGSGSEAEPQLRRGRWPAILIALAAVAIVLLVWIAAIKQSAFEREKAIQVATVQNANRALMLQQYVTRTLDAANIACLHVAELHAQGARFVGTAERPGFIPGPIAHNSNFLGLSFANAAGEIVATTLRDAPAMTNVRRHPAFTAHEQGTNRLFVSKPAFSRFLQRDTLWLSRRIDNADGSLAGVVAINMDPDQLTSIFKEAVTHPSEVVWVAGRDGIIRSRRTSAGASSGQDVTRSELFRAQQRIAEGDQVIRGTFDGEVRLVSYRRVPGYPLFVSYSVRQDEVLAEANRRARLFWFGAVAVTLAAAVLAFLLVSALRRREQHARELALAKARLEGAQRIARIGDWTVSLADGRVAWSPQLFEMYERDPALGPPGIDTFEALLAEGSPWTDGAPLARLAEGGVPAAWEVRAALPSGRASHLLVSAVPTRNGDGAVVGAHGTVQDVTERRKLEALQDDLAHLSRIGEMNALTATLSHELNQPLTAAGNYLSVGESLASSLAEPQGGPIANVIREARGQITRTGEIIQRMRNLVSKGASSRAVVSLDEVLEEALAIVAVTGICPGPVRMITGTDDVRVSVDSVQIQQVVLNLVRNACEAQKGRDVPPPRIEISNAGDEAVVVSVVDHGTGMPEEIRDRLFEPFTSSKQSGLGLGLSISRTIIEAHGGTIRAGNNESGGASVSFTLPVHARSARRRARARAAATG